jgi:AcrR family transcriptional regulator
MESARRCFHSYGYGATTLRQVAEGASVAVQTVYAVFGSKANILRALRLEVIGDPEADAAWALALQAPDNDAAIDAFARSIRLRWEHGADVVAINREASRTDPQVRSEVDVAERIRRTGIGEVAASLIARDASLGSAATLAAQLEALTGR